MRLLCDHRETPRAKCLELTLSRTRRRRKNLTSSGHFCWLCGTISNQLLVFIICCNGEKIQVGWDRYKGKAIITGVLLKQVCVRVTTYDTAMWLKPYFGVTVATVLWDGMTCHSIMKGAELRAIGVTTSIEVFNEIILKFFPGYVVDTSVLSEKARVQLLRAIGVAIVKKGAMFPTMELLLRHARE